MSHEYLTIERQGEDGRVAVITLSRPEKLNALNRDLQNETRAACEAERAFLARLGGGCRLPFGALATVKDGTLHARGFISDPSGANTFRAEESGAPDEPQAVGVRLAERLLEQGAVEFVEAIEAR